MAWIRVIAVRWGNVVRFWVVSKVEFARFASGLIGSMREREREESGDSGVLPERLER